MTDLCEQSATWLTTEIRAGRVSATAAVDAYLDRIDRENNDLNAYITVIAESAREAAREADTAVDRGEPLGALHGVPIALKDLDAMKAGVRHTFGSKLCADYEAHRTAVIVERLEDAGAIVLGKTNTPELGHAGVTTNKLVGPTASPVDRSLNAGGSSGGSAAAVGAGMAALATGSDAGGSIRIPAACCGVFGMKPSFGVVPNDSRPNGFGKKRHHTACGPLARTVADGALMLDVLAGPHAVDPGSVPVDADFRSAVGRSIDDYTVAYSPALDVFDVEPAVQSVIEDALPAFETAGVTIEEIEVDHGCSLAELAEAVEVTFTTSVAGAVETIATSTGVDFREHPDDVSGSLLAMVQAGQSQTTADLERSGVVRTRLYDAVQTVFESADILVTPTLACGGFDREVDSDAVAWGDVLTWPFNVTGHPVASVPVGRTGSGEPVGLQVVGRRYADETVLAASAAVEANVANRN